MSAFISLNGFIYKATKFYEALHHSQIFLNLLCFSRYQIKWKLEGFEVQRLSSQASHIFRGFNRLKLFTVN